MVLIHFPTVHYILAFDKDKPVLLCVGLRVGFREGIAGLVVQHLADRDRGRDPGHPGHRHRELGLATAYIEQAVCRPEDRTVARGPEEFAEMRSPPFRDFFTSSAIEVIVSARSLSVMPVYVFLWLTQSEKEEWFFLS